MAPNTFSKQSVVAAPVEEVFAWHTRPGAFERLNPPWRPVQILSASGGIKTGARVTIQLPAGPISIPWTLEHIDYIENRQFRDRQVSGPMRSWDHVHLFEEAPQSACLMTDRIEYQLPLALSLGGVFVKQELERLFHYRHSIVKADFELHRRWAGQERTPVLISGSSGFIGSALTHFLSTAGHPITRLVRSGSEKPGFKVWNPDRGEIDARAFDGIETVIHLGGEDISNGRWGEEKKARIRSSRVESTKLLAGALASLPKKPKTLIVASAVGIYGDTADTIVDERSAPGTGFLADVGQEWEAATKPAIDAGVRVVNVRIGVVLNPGGGALKKMLPAFLCGAGGPLGSGKQYMSWVALQDLLGIFEHALFDSNLSGPVNAVAPSPVTNEEFTTTLGTVLNRPTFLRAPEKALSMAFGEMAQAALLASTRAVPTALIQHGYRFLLPNVADALRFELGY